MTVSRSVKIRSGGELVACRTRPAGAPREHRAGAVRRLRTHRAPLPRVLHRVDPEPEHSRRVSGRLRTVRRLVRRAWARARPGRTDGRRRLRRAARRDPGAGDGQAAPRGDPHAVRSPRRRPGPAVQSGERGARTRSTSCAPARRRSSPPSRRGSCSTPSTSTASSGSATAR